MALRGNIGRYMARTIHEVAERYDFEIVELAVMPDLSPAQIVQRVKIMATKRDLSRLIRQIHIVAIATRTRERKNVHLVLQLSFFLKIYRCFIIQPGLAGFFLTSILIFIYFHCFSFAFYLVA